MAQENFFDFQARISTPLCPLVPPAPLAAGRDALSVSQLTARIEQAIKSGVPATVRVQGEVSNFNRHRASGHIYFTLKDSTACIDCVMFRSDAGRLKFSPDDGMELLATGRVAIYPQRGRYQLYVTAMQPLGRGALELAFQQLRAKLQAEGLFDPKRKKPLPRYPMRVVLLTSRATAALQDMLKVLRRFPWVRLFLFHVPVQGDGSAGQIAAAIELLNSRSAAAIGPDLILLSRGGGSLEDLWEFNEEVVARAIAGSKIPIVTGIGHEVDVSIADLVADHHAHTPTEAAQVAMNQWRGAKDAVDLVGVRMRRALRSKVSDLRQRLNSIERHEIFRRPTDRINTLRQLLDDRQRALQLAVSDRLRLAQRRVTQMIAKLREMHPRHALRLNRERLTGFRSRLHRAAANAQQRRHTAVATLAGHLNAIGPQQVLARGYSITTLKKEDRILRSVRQLHGGETLQTRLADGTIESVARDPAQPPLFE